jgi:hypothetical protein
MLKLAYFYKSQIADILKDLILDPHYFYMSQRYDRDYEPKFEPGTANELAFVSVDSKGQLLGYFCAEVHRAANYIINFQAVNFSKTLHPVFSRDLATFVDDIFCKFNFNKLCISVTIGNPAEKMYDKYVRKYGGRIAAYYTDDCLTVNGEIRDVKIYEIRRGEYLTACKLKFGTFGKFRPLEELINQAATKIVFSITPRNIPRIPWGGV